MLVVATVAVTEVSVPATEEEGTPLTDVEVCAAEIVTGRAAEELPM